MEKKTFIDKIKALFSEVENGEEKKKEMKEVTTQDGIVLKTEGDFVVGAEVMIVSEDGEVLAQTDEYKTDTQVITVEDGIITDVKEVEAVTEEVEVEAETKKDDKIEEEMNFSEDKDEDKKDEKLEEEGTNGNVETEIEVEMEVEEDDEMEKRLKAIEQAIVDISENMGVVEKLSKVVSEIADLPADKEIKLSKASQSQNQKVTNKEERLKFFSKRK